MKRLVVANRGEIARRILKAARGRDYIVAVVSTPDDRDAVVRREADDVLEVGSFLDAAAIVAAAKQWGATALHPGYGFLSENAGFSESVESAGIVFVGPRAESMRQLGNKERAKQLAAGEGVPVLEAVSSQETKGASVKALETCLREKNIDPPYLVKAAGGGGGRGMRVVSSLEALPRALERASEEAMSGFSDPTVFVERYLREPRHVEIQVFGDGEGGGVFLGERECSMQRRHQKVIEEAPSPVVDRALRERMGRAALALVGATAYRGAGTVEFLLDSETAFLLPRGEHPAPGGASGDGARLRHRFSSPRSSSSPKGSGPLRLPTPRASSFPSLRVGRSRPAFWPRIPVPGFLPTPGPLVRYREPEGTGLRVDSGVTEGARIHPNFDSLIAKVIASGETRESKRSID